MRNSGIKGELPGYHAGKATQPLLHYLPPSSAVHGSLAFVSLKRERLLYSIKIVAEEEEERRINATHLYCDISINNKN